MTVAVQCPVECEDLGMDRMAPRRAAAAGLVIERPAASASAIAIGATVGWSLGTGFSSSSGSECCLEATRRGSIGGLDRGLTAEWKDQLTALEYRMLRVREN